jgi:glycyl-tRNA synthetase beta subunit
VLKRLVIKAGIETGNRNISFKLLRKFLLDRLSSHMSTEKFKQIVGKAISEGAYISADSLREDYKRAMVETTFSKLTSSEEIELQVKRQAIMEKLGMSKEEIKRLFQTKKASTLQAQVSLLEEIAEAQLKEKANGCADSEHCQRLVTEQELETLLTQGWNVVLCLPSGKIVVSNDR